MSNPDSAPDGDGSEAADPTGLPPPDSPNLGQGQAPPATLAELAQGLKGLRILRGWAQDDVACALRWRTSKLSRFELALRVPSPGDVGVLLEFYEIPTDARSAWFDARAEAEEGWMLDQILAATNARQFMDSVTAGAGYDAFTQVAHQLRGLLWAHQQHIDRADLGAALWAERAEVSSRLAVIGPDSAAVRVVARHWGTRARALRASAARISSPDPHVQRAVAEDVFDHAIRPHSTATTPAPVSDRSPRWSSAHQHLPLPWPPGSPTGPWAGPSRSWPTSYGPTTPPTRPC